MSLHTNLREASEEADGDEPALGGHQIQVSLEYRTRTPVTIVAPPPQITTASAQERIVWELDLTPAFLGESPAAAGRTILERKDWQCPICKSDIHRPCFLAMHKHFLCQHPSFSLQDLGVRFGGRHVRLTPRDAGLTQIRDRGRRGHSAHLEKKLHARPVQQVLTNEAAATKGDQWKETVAHPGNEAIAACHRKEAAAHLRQGKEITAKARHQDEDASRARQQEEAVANTRPEEVAAPARQEEHAVVDAGRPALVPVQRYAKDCQSAEQHRADRLPAETAKHQERVDQADQRRQAEQNGARHQPEGLVIRRQEEEEQVAYVLRIDAASPGADKDTSFTEIAELAAQYITDGTQKLVADDCRLERSVHRSRSQSPAHDAASRPVLKSPLAPAAARSGGAKDVQQKNGHASGLETNGVPRTPPSFRIPGKGSERDPLRIEVDEGVITRAERGVNGSRRSSAQPIARNRADSSSTPSKGSELDPIDLDNDDPAKLAEALADGPNVKVLDAPPRILSTGLERQRGSSLRAQDDVPPQPAAQNASRISSSPMAAPVNGSHHLQSALYDRSSPRYQPAVSAARRKTARVQIDTLACALDEIDEIWDGAERLPEVRERDEVRVHTQGVSVHALRSLTFLARLHRQLVWNWHHLSEKQRLLMCIWNRYQCQHG